MDLNFTLFAVLEKAWCDWCGIFGTNINYIWLQG